MGMLLPVRCSDLFISINAIISIYVGCSESNAPHFFSFQNKDNWEHRERMGWCLVGGTGVSAVEPYQCRLKVQYCRLGVEKLLESSSTTRQFLFPTPYWAAYVIR
jgi:hypothetical protein